MKCMINGDERDLPEGSTVRDLLQELTGQVVDANGRSEGGQPLGLAVALDGALVPRSSWSFTAVTPGCSVDVVEAVQGG